MVAFEFHRPVVFPSVRLAGAGSACETIAMTRAGRTGPSPASRNAVDEDALLELCTPRSRFRIICDRAV